MASVVIPTWNGAHLLEPCLRSLAEQTYPALEVIVADGASRDESHAVTRRALPDARFLRLSRNRGFAGNVNAGLRAARGDVLLLLNNDARAARCWVETCVDALQGQPRLGAVASQITYEDTGRVNSAGDGLLANGMPYQRGAGDDPTHWSDASACLGASGGAAAYRREMLEDVGLLDEVFFAYLEDMDLALRAQLRGWTCRYEPSARVVHRGRATSGGVLESYLNGRNLIRLLVKDLPGPLLRARLPHVLAGQIRRARDAAGAWQGREARATLRGQMAGLLGLPAHLRARAAVQRRRTAPVAYIASLMDERP